MPPTRGPGTALDLLEPGDVGGVSPSTAMVSSETFTPSVRHDIETATQIMLNVHHQGVGIAGVYTREIGETKVAVVHRMAKKNQFPLRCSLEKDC